MEGHSQLANCVRGKTMALFKPLRYLVSKPPNLDVAKEAGILCECSEASYNSRCTGEGSRDALQPRVSGSKRHTPTLKLIEYSRRDSSQKI